MNYLEETEEYDAEATVGNQSLRAAAVARRPAMLPRRGPVSSGDEVRRKVELRAYQIFQKRGCAHGCALDDWLKAEKEVLAEIERAASAG